MMSTLLEDTTPCWIVLLTPEAARMMLTMRVEGTVNCEVMLQSPKLMMSSDGSRDQLAERVVVCCVVAVT